MSDQRQGLREQEEVEASLSGQKSALDASLRQLAEKKENPEFVDALRQIGINSEKYDWIEDELGAMLADVHLIANRREGYRDYARYLNRNRVERKIAQHNPGRLCKGNTRAIAQRVHMRDDKDVREPWLSDDRQQLRLGSEAATAFHTIGVDSSGMSAVSDVTAVSRVERSEETSRVEQASGILNK